MKTIKRNTEVDDRIHRRSGGLRGVGPVQPCK